MCVGCVSIRKIKKCHFSRIGRVLDADLLNNHSGRMVGTNSAVQ